MYCFGIKLCQRYTLPNDINFKKASAQILTLIYVVPNLNRNEDKNTKWSEDPKSEKRETKEKQKRLSIETFRHKIHSIIYKRKSDRPLANDVMN